MGIKFGLLVTVFAAGFAASANAGVTMYGNLSDWQAAAQHYNETQVTAETEFSTANTVSGLKDGSTLTNLNPATTVYIVGSSWGTWQGAPNPTVYWTGSSAVLTADFNPGIVSGHPVDAFGFYAEGDNFQDDDITLALSDGMSLTQTVNGDAGAEFFGWVGSGITGITVSTNDTDSFAIGDFWEGYSTSESVPEPLTLSLFGAGLAGAAVLRRRKKAKG
jgi:hypothetical protein